MTQDELRKDFEESFPLPDGIEFVDEFKCYAASFIKYAKVIDYYNAKWEGYQSAALKRSAEFDTLQHERDDLMARVFSINEADAKIAALKALLRECQQSLDGVPMSKRSRGDARLSKAIDSLDAAIQSGK